ncbi:MAG: polysaccharide deacetylase family protein [Candidatus Binatia bacterium]
MSKDITVCLSYDFDAMSLWIATFHTESPNALSRGEFGRVGAQRILDLLAEYNIKSTWFVPGHTIEAFPAECQRLVDEGHEVGHHGYCHENAARLAIEQERAILQRGIALIKDLTGRAPWGYRSPAGSFSPNTVRLLLDHGFVYDSSLLGDDFTPYYCRDGIKASIDAPYDFGTSVDLVEMPFSWSLDDFPIFEYTSSRHGINQGLADPARVYDIWAGDFEYLYTKMDKGVFILTMHPQVIGRGHRMLMLERFIKHLQSHDGVTFSTMGAFVQRWKAEHPFTGAALTPSSDGSMDLTTNLELSWPDDRR